MAESLVSAGGLRIRLKDPEIVKGPAVRYVLRLEAEADSRTYFDSLGWRISRGKIYVPARATRLGWVDQARLSLEGEESMIELVQAWKDEFSGVEFP